MKPNHYKHRNIHIRIFIAAIIILFIIRLINLQLIDNYDHVADNNAFYRKTVYAPRGLIYDRNNELLVYNQPIYDLMVTTRTLHNNARHSNPLDTLGLCKLLGISQTNFKQRIKDIKNKRKNRGYSPLIPQRFLTQLTPQEYAVIQEQLRKYPGFSIENRTLRKFTHPCATHALGRIGEVSKKAIEKEPSRYKRGDYIGESGLEKQYEKSLRGENGVEILLRDARGRIKGSYENGTQDISPTAGKNITVSLDIQLQEYGEKLLAGKKGSVVAIQPHTGEILALISSPTYDPSELVGRHRSRNYNKLLHDPQKPLLERALMARYPPGSTFKTLNALVCEQEGIITEHTHYNCHNGYTAGRFHLGCHHHKTPLDLANSISNSCNAYYCEAWRAFLENKKYKNTAEAFDIWKDYAVKFGFGYKLGVDCPNENRGYIPNSSVYNRVYGKGRWRALTIISLSIGQGEILATPIQIANLAASIANKGYWITPHLVKAIKGDTIDSKYTQRHETGISAPYFDPIIQGMEWAVNGGPTGSTARKAKVDSIIVCGKTGTAENPHGEDHSILMCFAPKENPQIAMVVIIENGGFGNTIAAPIASLMLEKYFMGKLSPQKQLVEKRILNTHINYN